MPTGVVSRSNFPNLHERGIRTVYFNELELQDSGIIERFFNMKTSEKRQERDVVVAGLGQALPTSEGGDPNYDSIEEAWLVTYLHTAWSIAMVFTHEAMADNLYLTLGTEGAKEMARAMAYTRQVQGHSFLNDNTVTIYSYGGSNYPLLSAAHPLVGGGTWRNKRDNTVLLSQEALEDAYQAWSTEMVDLRGRKLSVKPTTLLHGASDEFLVKRLLNSMQRPQGANNDVNPLKDLDLQGVMSPHLTNDGRWFLLGPKRSHRLNFFDREKPLMKRVDSTSNWNQSMMSYMRFSKGASSPESIWGSAT